DAEHMLLRTVRCVDGQAQLTLDCVPAFDYGRQHARWRHTERGYTQAVVEPEGLDLTLTLTSDIRLGLEGSSARGRTLLKEGDTRFCALSWGRRIPEGYADAYRRLVWTAHHWQHWLSHGRFPDHRWRAHPQGPDVRAHRRDRRCGHHLAARDAGRGAQLGLPVHLDARRHVRAVG